MRNEICPQYRWRITTHKIECKQPTEALRRRLADAEAKTQQADLVLESSKFIFCCTTIRVITILKFSLNQPDFSSLRVLFVLSTYVNDATILAMT